MVSYIGSIIYSILNSISKINSIIILNPKLFLFLGAVVASRLSEIPDWKVLLLEAGPDENEISDVPALAAYLQLGRIDWQYKTEPTGQACLGMKGTGYTC